MSLNASRTETPPRRGVLLAGAALALVAALLAFAVLRGGPEPARHRRPTPSEMQAKAAGDSNVPERLKVLVLSTRPHDPGAHTQGLFFLGYSALHTTAFNRRPSL